MAIGAVQFTLFDAGKQASFVSGPTNIYKLGYFWWLMGEYSLGLEYIRFGKQNFLPPTSKVDGYGWNFLADDIKGDFQIVWTKLDELPVEVIGQAIGLASGQIGGLRAMGLGGLTGPDPTLIKRGPNMLRGYVRN